MRFEINNFVGDFPMTASTSGATESTEATVFLSQHHGSLSLAHHMNPAQAREMATALNKLANEIDPQADPQTQKPESAQWQPVTVDTPSDREMVFCNINQGRISVGEIDNMSWYPTHWMPLPDLPKA